MSFAKFEKAAFAYFPHNYQWVYATVGSIAGIVGFTQIRKDLKPPALKPKAEATSAPTATASKDGYEAPTLANFDKWSNSEANWARWEKSLK